MDYYIKTDIDAQPKRLLRAEGSVEVWYQGEWRETALMPAELDGLGGSSDYYRINEGDVVEWQSTLNG